MSYNDSRNIDLNNIENSYDYIIECFKEHHINKILKYLISNNVDLNNIFNYLDKNDIYIIYYNDVVEELIKLGKLNIVEKYLNYFYRKNSSLLELKSILQTEEINIDEINNLINNNPNLVIEEITRYPVEYLEEQKLYDFFKIMIEELLTNEGKQYSDIEILGQGGYSKVFGVGSKVLKIGEPRATLNIKDNRRFLKPLYRKNIKYLNSSFTIFCVEITERLDMTNITYDDVYEIYKELRDQGLVWLDAKRENVGRLIRDNKLYFDGIDYVDKESTSYTTDDNEVLLKGSLMLVDNDLIYDEEKFFKKYDYDEFGYSNTFEARYRKEKENEKRSRGKL